MGTIVVVSRRDAATESELLAAMLTDVPSMLLRCNEPSGSTAADSAIGNAHPGTLGAGASFGATALYGTDTSVDLPGTDATSYIDVADHSAFDRGDGAFTIAVVLARDTTNVPATIAGKGTTGGIGWGFRFTAGGNYLALGKADGVTDHAYGAITNWDTAAHLYVATYDGTTHHLYEDGVDITESSEDAVYANTTDTLRIGANQYGAARLDGRVGYVAFYPTAVSAARVLAWAVAGGFAVETPPSEFVVHGYGAPVTGGTGYSDVHVTNLNASGAGSLAAAMGSNRRIVFDVGGTIDLTSVGDEIGGTALSNFTIDGSTAPAPGITIIGWGLEFSGCSNFIIRHLAIRDTDAVQFQSSLTLRNACANFVLDHISADGYSHRGIDVYNGCHDGTIQWCLVGRFGPTGLSNFPVLVGKIVDRVSVDHCLFYDGDTRMPQFDYDNADGAGPVPAGITGDMANCLVYEWDYSGLTLHGNAKVNVRQSYFASTTNTTFNLAIHTETGASVYRSGCVGKGGVVLTAASEVATPYAVAPYAELPLETDAYAAANACLASAGRSPRDATDTAIVNAIVIS